jgi:hypothetical protein
MSERGAGHRRLPLISLAVLAAVEVAAYTTGAVEAGAGVVVLVAVDVAVAVGMFGYAVGPVMFARDRADFFEFRLNERLNRVRRRPRSLAGAPEPILVGYTRGFLPVMIGAAFGDVVLVVVLAVVLPAGPVRTAVHLVGAVGLLWVIGFVTSLHVYRHAVGPSAVRLRFGGMYDALVEWEGDATLTKETRSWDGGRSGQVRAESLVFPIMNATNMRLVLERPAVVRSVNRELDGARVSQLYFVADQDVTIPGAR